MPTAIVTGAGGLIGAECVRELTRAGFDVIGIDNDMRSRYFGPAASTQAVIDDLTVTLPGYRHVAVDIRDEDAVDAIFSGAQGLELVVHAAAQPSHDWAASDPRTDFGVNAVGTMNLLEATRRHALEATFVFMSTNKVYGDRPNDLPLLELETRLEIDPAHRYAQGIDDSMSIDRSLHSLFGVSKASADLMVQEYGRYFGMPTVCFRAGCLTGPAHAGAQLHGFLSYLMRCAMTGEPYTVIGHGGKQVRDNLHSADVVAACPGVPRRSRARRRLQPRRRTPQQLLRARGDRAAARRSPGASWRGSSIRWPARAITGGGSATCARFRRAIRRGRSATAPRRSCARSTTTTPTAGCPRARPSSDEHAARGAAAPGAGGRGRGHDASGRGPAAEPARDGAHARGDTGAAIRRHRRLACAGVRRRCATRCTSRPATPCSRSARAAGCGRASSRAACPTP